MRTTTQLLEVQLEELDRPFWDDALADSVAASFGTGVYRFTGRVLSDQGYEDVRGRAFAMPRREMQAHDRPTASSSRALARLCELDEQLQGSGWAKTAELGEHWWSLRYTRS